MLALNVRQIFKKYQLVVEEKGTMTMKIIEELIKMGLVSPAVLEIFKKKEEEEEEKNRKLEEEKEKENEEKKAL